MAPTSAPRGVPGQHVFEADPRLERLGRRHGNKARRHAGLVNRSHEMPVVSHRQNPTPPLADRTPTHFRAQVEREPLQNEAISLCGR
jgi:hypothetical protein